MSDFMKKTYMEFDDNSEELDDVDMGPWSPNPKNIYATLKPKISEQITESPAQRKRKNLSTILYKKPTHKLDTKSMDLKETKTPPSSSHQKQRLLPLIIPKQYTHKLKRETHLPIITARQEYGDIFKYTKPSKEIKKFDEIAIHDQLRSHSFRKKQKSKNMFEKSSKQQNQLLTNIECLIGKQSPTFNIYEKCIVQVKKHNSCKDKSILRNSFKLF